MGHDCHVVRFTVGVDAVFWCSSCLIIVVEGVEVEVSYGIVVAVLIMRGIEFGDFKES